MASRSDLPNHHHSSTSHGLPARIRLIRSRTPPAQTTLSWRTNSPVLAPKRCIRNCQRLSSDPLYHVMNGSTLMVGMAVDPGTAHVSPLLVPRPAADLVPRSSTVRKSSTDALTTAWSDMQRPHVLPDTRLSAAADDIPDLRPAPHRAYPTLKRLPSLPALNFLPVDLQLDLCYDAVSVDKSPGAITSHRRGQDEDIAGPDRTRLPVSVQESIALTAPTTNIKRRLSRNGDHHRSWLLSSKSAVNLTDRSAREEPISSPPALAASETPVSRGISGPLASLARRSWIPSRSLSSRRRQDTRADSAGPTLGSSETAVKTETAVKPLSNLSKSAILSENIPEPKYPNIDSTSRPSRPVGRAGNFLMRLTLRSSSVPSPSPKLTLSAATDPEKRPKALAHRTSGRDLRSTLTPNTASDETRTLASAVSSSAAVSVSDIPGSEATAKHFSASSDPLESAVNALQAEAALFASRDVAKRLYIIRSMLITFLQSTKGHPSNHGLSLPHLARRGDVLGAWWMILLDMLEGRDARQPSTSPVLFDAVAMIMARPEWRQASTSFLPLADRSAMLHAQSRSATGSTRVPSFESLSQSDYHYDADFAVTPSPPGPVRQNIRDTFVKLLHAQAAYVADRVSRRYAPPVLINFAGQVFAYVFLFAPVTADLLVRFWSPQQDHLRRAADGLGLPRRSQGKTADIEAFFPHDLAPFFWSSASELAQRFGRLPRTFFAHPHPFQWQGPWMPRWRGRETELFFVFCKHYHGLIDEFIPPGLPLAEKARVPAFVLVHAQLLTIIDHTMHQFVGGGLGGLGLGSVGTGPSRSASYPLSDNIQHADPFNDTIPLPSIPISSSHGTRSMADNRLIIVLRELVSGSFVRQTGARHTFIEAFMAMTVATTRSISLFDQTACFALCDFLEALLLTFSIEGEDHDLDHNAVEETLADHQPAQSNPLQTKGKCAYDQDRSPVTQSKNISRDEGGSIDRMGKDSAKSTPSLSSPARDPAYIDWAFWLPVLDMMLSSLHTVVEIRVLSVVFTAWHALTACPRRKEQLCCQWLLREDIFDKFFNNWSPMVRAYYMRLLCWRICRDSGHATEADVGIFRVVAQRLCTAWSHYVYLTHLAEVKLRLPPSTMPCEPAPGKKFMIIRQELPVPQPGILSSPDPPGSVSNVTHPARAARVGTSDDGARAKVDPKRRWSLLGKMMSLTPFGGSELGPSSSTSSAKSSWFDEMLDRSQSEGTANKFTTAPESPYPITSSASLGPRRSIDSDSLGSAPIFEAQVFIFRFMLSSIPAGLSSRGHFGGIASASPSARNISKPCLPAPAQVSVSTGSNVGMIRTDDAPQLAVPITATLTPTCGATAEPTQGRLLKPIGFYAGRAVYVGRALAEWALVVHECDIFVERRRDEGVLELGNVEVPSLGVDGFRRSH